MSITFDADDSRLVCGSDASIDNIWDSGGALVSWVYDAGAQGGNFGRIFSKWDTGGWNCYINSNDNLILFEVDFDGAADGKWSITRPTQSVWWHLAISYDSGATANDPDVYVNAVLQNESETSTPVGTRVSDAGDVLSIGNIAAEVRGLNGQLEDCRLFAGGKLTQKKISILAAGYRGVIGGEALWFSMMESRGAFTGTLTEGTHILPDLSANTNDGDPHNGCILSPSEAPRYGIAV